MAANLYYQTKHVIEYNCDGAFGGSQIEMNEFMESCGCSICADNCEEKCCAASYCVSKSDIRRMLRKLRKRDPKEIIVRAKPELYYPAYRVKDAVAFFEKALENADKDCSDIHFDWF